MLSLALKQILQEAEYHCHTNAFVRTRITVQQKNMATKIANYRTCKSFVLATKKFKNYVEMVK